MLQFHFNKISARLHIRTAEIVTYARYLPQHSTRTRISCAMGSLASKVYGVARRDVRQRIFCTSSFPHRWDQRMDLVGPRN
jgi:hypothetical protein